MSERRRLPDERPAITRRFVIGGHKCYVTIGLFEDNTPGEIFVRIAKTGGTLSGLLDNWAITTSMALQHGVPLETLIDKMSYTRFEPAGWSGIKEIGYATSLLDLIMRWIKIRFLPGPALPEPVLSVPPPPPDKPPVPLRGDGPPCDKCGTIMLRSGTCWSCPNCASTSGCG